MHSLELVYFIRILEPGLQLWPFWVGAADEIHVFTALAAGTALLSRCPSLLSPRVGATSRQPTCAGVSHSSLSYARGLQKLITRINGPNSRGWHVAGFEYPARRASVTLKRIKSELLKTGGSEGCFWNCDWWFQSFFWKWPCFWGFRTSLMVRAQHKSRLRISWLKSIDSHR